MADSTVETLRSELSELRTDVQKLRDEFRDLNEEVDKLKSSSGDGGAASTPSKPLGIKVVAPSNFGAKFHQWNIKSVEKVPAKIPRPYGALKDGKVYFNAGLTTRGGQYQSFVHCFDVGTEKWKTLPKNTQYYGSVAIIQDMLTIIGGKMERGERVTGNLVSFQVSPNKLNTTVSLFKLCSFSFKESGKSGEWQECLPPLPNPRFFTGAATTENILVVAGGDNGKMRVATVEVLDMDSMQWTEVCPLPEATSNATMVIIGDSVFVLAGMKVKGNYYTNAAYTCSLSSLVKSSPTDEDIWEVLPPVPQDSATATVICNTLVAVGGWINGRTEPVKNMVAYSSESKK